MRQLTSDNKTSVHLIGIRTHQWTDLENNLYQKLQQYFCADDIFVIVDETKALVNTPNYIKKISLNLELLDRLGILSAHPNVKGLGWLCGDYFYYAFANFITAPHYWLIEPDVDFTFENISDFFDRYATKCCDALLHNFAPAPDSWAWTKRAEQISNETYQAFFPLSRLSRQAIEVCLQERQRLTADFLANDTDRFMYPNDESLVATSVVKHGLTVEKLNNPANDHFRYFSYQNAVVMPKAVAYLFHEQQIIHPSKTPKSFAHILVKDIKTALKNSTDIRTRIARSHFHLDDIDAIVNTLQDEVLAQIKKMLKQKAQTDALRHFVYRQIDNQSKQSNNRIQYKKKIRLRYKCSYLRRNTLT